MASSAWAADGLPPSLQAIMFKKVMDYDRALPKGKRKVLVVYGDDATGAAEMAQAFRDVEIEAEEAKADAAAGRLNGVVAIYTMPSGLKAEIRELCVSKKLLSMSGQPRLVEKGEVSIALGKRGDGRPEISINLTRAKEEGRDLSSDLLGLAKVVK